MKQRTRIYYSDVQKAVMWERWKQGWTLHQIVTVRSRSHLVQGILCDWWYPTTATEPRQLP